MAFADADREVAYSRLTTTELRERPGLAGLCNMAHEAELTMMPGGWSTVIQDIQFGTATDVSEETTVGDFNAKWGDGDEIAATQITVKVDRELRQNSIVKDYDAGSMSYDPVDRVRQSQSNKWAVHLSHQIGAYWLSLGKYSTQNPAAADLPNQAGNGPNGNAGKVFDFGTIGANNTNALKGDESEATFGDPQGNADQRKAFGLLIDTFLRRVARRAVNTYIYNGEAIGPSIEDRLWVAADPSVWDFMAWFYADNNLFNMRLNESLVSEGTPRIFTDGDTYGGSIYGLSLVSDLAPALRPVQTNDATKGAGFPIFAGTRDAVTCAVSRMRAQELSPETNQVRPVHALRQWGYWGRGLVNAPLLMTAKINSVA